MKTKFIFCLLLVGYTLSTWATPHHIIRRNQVVMARLDRDPGHELTLSEMPPAMVAWTQWAGTGEDITTAADHVDPLIETEWGQSAPYNDSCPLLSTGARAAAGCVAIAMAQAAYYWQDYLPGIDWENILPNYTDREGRQATDAQRAAVASLVSNCGLMANTKYGTTSSAATSKIGKALVTYCNFNPGMRFISRRYCTYAEWAEMMRNELRAGRPIIYRGESSTIGHCFLIDGFDEQGYFHVNWGWNGTSNGWFRFTAMTPNALGTGGGSSYDGYNYLQGMYIDAAPAAVLRTSSVPRLEADSLTANKNKQGKDSLRLHSYKNMSASDTLSGYIALGIYDGDLLVTKGKKQAFTAPPLCAYSRNYNNFTLPSLTPGKTYDIIAIWCDTLNQTNWQPIIGRLGEPVGLTVRINSDSSATYLGSHNPMGTPRLLAYDSCLFAQNMRATFNATWTCDSNEWNGRVLFALENDSNYQLIYKGALDMQANEVVHDCVYTDVLTVPAGKYLLRPGYYDGATIRWIPSSDSVVVEARTIATTVTLMQAPTLNDTLFTPLNPHLTYDIPVTLSAILPKDAVFSGRVALGIYEESYPNPTTRIRNVDGEYYVTLTKQDTLWLHFEDDSGLQLPNGRYRLMLRVKQAMASTYTVKSSTWITYFTVSDGTTVLSEPAQHPQPNKIIQDGQLFIIHNNRRYTTSGQQK